MSNISRNFEEREEIIRKIRDIEDAKKNALDAIEHLSDDEYEKAFNEIEERYSTAAFNLRLTALEYKECRNEWFKKFVESFGICEDRRITKKQADIFVKYAEPTHNKSWFERGKYYVRVRNLFIEVSKFQYDGYVTIREFN